MLQTINEFELLVKLKYPDIHTDPDGFIDALPDEFVIEHFYINQNYSVEEKRSSAKSFFHLFPGPAREDAHRIFWKLVNYHSKKDNTTV